jgi:transcription elongation factor Elf1
MYRKYKCPTCNSTSSVVRNRQRGRSIQYLCKACKKLFSVRVRFEEYTSKDLMNDHLDGLSFGKIADKYKISKGNAYNKVFEELSRLPDNNRFTLTNCTRFSKILVPDAKYIATKGYDRKIAFLWGVDYFTHDFPIILLAPSENYDSWKTYFKMIKEVHSYELIVCDDNLNIKSTASYHLPKVDIQACYNHLKENIRRNLKVRSDDTYSEFMSLIEDTFSVKRSEEDFNNRLFYIFKKWGHDDKARYWIIELTKNSNELLAFRGYRHAPTTTNLIESFNSHLEARLFSMKGFESFEHARLWLNGYVLKRRFTKLRNCTGKFRILNGKTPLQQSLKHGLDLKGFF